MSQLTNLHSDVGRLDGSISNLEGKIYGFAARLDIVENNQNDNRAPYDLKRRLTSQENASFYMDLKIEDEKKKLQQLETEIEQRITNLEKNINQQVTELKNLRSMAREQGDDVLRT
ncbi:hypothetical protein Hamer_G005231 [Homarus americanus]|uniref:Uncharacterized protein n=2 Tax=Homarus americanus TaxID=6706 RepID=A0A8J5MVE5_HOMAM|nr:hypothetical protein Hamer_G005231 [Homarus americanus]